MDTSSPPPPDATDAAQAVLAQLFEAYPDALVVSDAAGRIVLANRLAAALLGYGHGELIGLPVDLLVPEGLRERHGAHRARFAAQPKTRPMGTQADLFARRKDGSHVLVEIALGPMQGACAGLVVAAMRDISASPRVKDVLRRAHYSEVLVAVGRAAVDARDVQAVLDRVPAAAAEALDVEVAALYLMENNSRELLVVSAFGPPVDGGTGHRIAYALNSSLGHVLSRADSLTSRDYRSERRFEVPQRYLDAGLRSALAVPVMDRGQAIGVLVVRSCAVRDFDDDERRFLESLANLLAGSLQRARSEEALAHAQRLESVGQLTGGIAHDFNNLLTVIQGNLQALEDLPALADGSGEPSLSAARRATRRGADLTSKLLAFSRRQLLQPRPVDVQELLGSLADLLRRTLDQRVRIALQIEGDCPHVLADEGQLEAALLNIAINARDAMPDGGELVFRARACATLPDGSVPASPRGADGGLVAIAVTDTGTGMAAAVKERAFEPFFTTKEAGRGTGLGLSTVYGFAAQSHGAVTLDSAPGMGTTVTLYIPRAERGSAERPAGPRAPQAALQGLRVLLVEDDAEVGDVVRRFLDALGCRVAAAGSGEQALALLEDDSRFDLLVTDIVLGPGMRGTELARRVRLRLPQLPVLLMSGYASELLEADRTAPLDWGLLSKPCTRDELAAAVATAAGLG